MDDDKCSRASNSSSKKSAACVGRGLRRASSRRQPTSRAVEGPSRISAGICSSPASASATPALIRHCARPRPGDRRALPAVTARPLRHAGASLTLHAVSRVRPMARAEDFRAHCTRISASTTVGLNCVPEPARSPAAPSRCVPDGYGRRSSSRQNVRHRDNRRRLRDVRVRRDHADIMPSHRS